MQGVPLQSIEFTLSKPCKNERQLAILPSQFYNVQEYGNDSLIQNTPTPVPWPEKHPHEPDPPEHQISLQPNKGILAKWLGNKQAEQ